MAVYQNSYADSYLIAVGIDSYSDARFSPLGSAESDARAVAEVLQAPPYNFNIRLLLGIDATKKAIIDALGELRVTLPDDRAVFYFAGHGYTLNDNVGNMVGYLACSDTEPTNPYAGLEFGDVTKVVRWAKAKHMAFVLDACFSGSALGLTRAAVPQASVEEYMQRRAYQVLTAGGDEVVSDATSMTDILVETLRQGIPGETGALTFSHVGQYVKDTVTARTKRLQIPVCQYLEGSSNGEMVLFVPPDAKPIDRLPERLRNALMSDDHEKRYYAVGDVQRLLSDPDLGAAARAVLDDLSVNDDSRDVRQRARQALGDLSVTPPPNPTRPSATLPLQGEGKPSDSASPATMGGVAAAPPEPVLEVSKRVTVKSPAKKAAPAAKPTKQPVTKGKINWLAIGGALAGVAALVVGGILFAPKGEQATPDSNSAQLGFTPVTRNADWTPHIEAKNGVDMALVPAGCFMMGSDAGDSVIQPVHEVCFDAPFWIDKTEVTNGQYGSEGAFGGAERPRDSVTWTGAKVHCEKRGARLPTEAEWEYAARGPDNLIYPWGNPFVADNVVFSGNSNSQTADVGSRPGGVSWIGAFDLSGNVWEWVADWYGVYSSEKQVNPSGPSDGLSRVIRGGAWYDSDALDLRASKRDGANPTLVGDGIGDNVIGFRCALSS